MTEAAHNVQDRDLRRAADPTTRLAVEVLNYECELVKREIVINKAKLSQ